MGRDDIPQINKISATHSLDILETEAPELPEGVERDPVKKQEDNAEAADVFGMVPIRLNTTSLSKYEISTEIISSLKCTELAIGDIIIYENHTIVEVHNKHASLAIRSLTSNGHEATIVEG